jgi:hypothetical protein
MSDPSETILAHARHFSAKVTDLGLNAKFIVIPKSAVSDCPTNVKLAAAFHFTRQGLACPFRPVETA